MFWRKLKRGKPHSVIIKCDHYLPVGNSFQVFQLLTLKAGEQSHILRPNKSLTSETRNISNCNVSLPPSLSLHFCLCPPSPATSLPASCPSSPTPFGFLPTSKTYNLFMCTCAYGKRLESLYNSSWKGSLQVI